MPLLRRIVRAMAASTIRSPTPRLPPITTVFLPVNGSILSPWCLVVTRADLMCKTGWRLKLIGP